MRVIPLQNNQDASYFCAKYIADKINQAKPSAEKPFILGLPTGGSPVLTYKYLVEMYKNKQLSFEHVVTFNMDEYVGIAANHPQSYHTFMYENLFNLVDIKAENINLLNGEASDLALECANYEQKIISYGGIDLFFGGVGVDGHIAFNEPFSSLNSRTRVQSLTNETIKVNSRFFDNDINQVPKQALTVGVGTLLDAKEVLIIASGTNKAQALAQGIEGAVSQSCTLSALQLHPNAIIACDLAACEELKVKTLNYFSDIEKDIICQHK